MQVGDILLVAPKYIWGAALVQVDFVLTSKAIGSENQVWGYSCFVLDAEREISGTSRKMAWVYLPGEIKERIDHATN